MQLNKWVTEISALIHLYTPTQCWSKKNHLYRCNMDMLDLWYYKRSTFNYQLNIQHLGPYLCVRMCMYSASSRKHPGQVASLTQG